MTEATWAKDTARTVPGAERPIFIGGTGRSGTSVMARLIASHRDVTLPAHENKLIAERFGLVSIVDELSSGFDWKSNHVTITNFMYWADVLRQPGFRNSRVARLHRVADRISKKITRRRIEPEFVCRKLPFLEYSLHAIGQGYGLEHYDKCIGNFLKIIVKHVDQTGIFDTEGVSRPFYISATADRGALIEASKNFLAELYGKPMRLKGAERWCDDSPINVARVQFLSELYPNSSIIHMVRDPRDVLTSYLEQSWVSNEPEITLERLARSYENVIKAEASGIVIRVRLEDLVNHHDAEVDRIFDFVKLDKGGFDFSGAIRGESLGRWRTGLSPELQRQVHERLGFAMEHFGYV